MHILVILGFVLTLSAAMLKTVDSLGLPPAAVCGLLAAEWVIVYLMAEAISQATARRLTRQVARPNPSILGFERLKLLGRLAVIGLHAVNLFVLGWPQLVLEGWHLAGIPAARELVLTAPFLGMVLLLLVGLYRGDRLIRVRHAESRVRAGAESTPLWTRWQYLDFHVRQSILIVLIPIVPVLAIKDLVMLLERLGAGWPPWVALAGLGVLVGAMFLCSPLVIRLAWGTKRLPDGPLRQRLIRLCERAKLRYRDLLLWRTHGVILNAGVIGYIGPLRYILVTDAAIEQLTGEELEAVFGHEIGHVAGHHFSYFFLFFVALMGFSLTVTFLLQRMGLSLPGASVEANEMGMELIGLAVTLAAAGLLFGLMSRRFERQSDLFGVQHIGCGDPRCPQACPVTGEPAPPGHSPVCPAAAGLFVGALEKIAWLNGTSADARSWRHFSIRLRRQFLLSCTIDPTLAAAFQRQVRLCKLLVAAGAVVFGGLGVVLTFLSFA